MNRIIFLFVVVIIPVKIMMKQVDDLFLKQNRKKKYSTVILTGTCFFTLCLNFILWEIMLSAGVDQTFAMKFGTDSFTAEQFMIRGLASLAFALWAPRAAHRVGVWFNSRKIKD